jgi:hypothetical protein
MSEDVNQARAHTHSIEFCLGLCLFALNSMLLHLHQIKHQCNQTDINEDIHLGTLMHHIRSDGNNIELTRVSV